MTVVMLELLLDNNIEKNINLFNQTKSGKIHFQISTNRDFWNNTKRYDKKNQFKILFRKLIMNLLKKWFI